MAGNFNYFNHIQLQQAGPQQGQPQVMDPSRAMAAAKSASRAPSQVPPSNVIQYLPVSTTAGGTQYYTTNPNIGAWLQLQQQTVAAGQPQQPVHLHQVR